MTLDELQIVITANLSKLAPQISAAKKQFTDFSESAQDSSNKASSAAEKSAEKVGTALKSETNAQEKAATAAKKAADVKSKSYAEIESASKKVKSAIPTETLQSIGALGARVKESLSSIAGSKMSPISTEKSQADLKKLQAEVDRTQAKLDKLNSKMADVYAKRDVAADKYSDVPALSGMTKDKSVDYLVGNDPKVKEYDAQLERLEAEALPLQSRLAEVRSKIAATGSESEPAGKKMRLFGDEMKSSQKNAVNLDRMLKSMLVRMALFAVMRTTAKAISEGLQDMARGNAQANSTMSQLATDSLQLKNSLAAALLPTLQAVTPVLNQIAEALSNVFNDIAMLTARIFNQASTVTIAQRANVNYAETLDGAKKSADAAKRSIMGFDELNVLSKPKAASSGNKPGMPDPSTMFKTVQIPPWVEKIGQITDKIKSMIEKSKDDIMKILVRSALVIGAILAFSGVNIPLGIGLMAFGAIGMAKEVATEWGTMGGKIKAAISIIAISEFILGAILAFSNANVPLGIGLMIGGAAAMAAEVAIDWGGLGKDLKDSISAISFAGGDAMLVLGAILAFSTADIPLGVGLMIGGATTLASAVALNWSGMSDQLKSTLTKITGIVGGACLALGIIITIATGGAGAPLGIGLILIGAANLAAAVGINWDTIKDKVKTVLADILSIASEAGIAIGLILCLTGVGLPLGLGLIHAGMKGVKAADDISSNPITDWAKNLVNGIIGIFESGVNYIIKMLDKVQFTVPDGIPGIGGKHFGIDISPVSIPRLASGGIVSDATTFMAGEHGKEAIMPLENNTGWMDGIADRIANRMLGSSGTGDINLTLPIYLDRNGSLVDTVIKKISRNGRNGNGSALVF